MAPDSLEWIFLNADGVSTLSWKEFSRLYGVTTPQAYKELDAIGRKGWEIYQGSARAESDFPGEGKVVSVEYDFKRETPCSKD